MGPADADARPAHAIATKDRDLYWRIKAKTCEELRQEFLSIYVPRLRELGLSLPDPELALDEASGEWRYTEPDWQELRTVVTNHGPKSQERLDFRRLNHAKTPWVRDTILAAPTAPRLAATERDAAADGRTAAADASPRPRHRRSRPGRSSARRRTATRCATAGR